MIAFLSLFLHVLVSPLKTQARLEAEIVMLRHQLNVLRRRVPSKPRLPVADRLIFVWLYRLFPSVLSALSAIEPETVLRWHRMGFRLYWRWKSLSRGGRPRIPGEIRRLIRDMSLVNRLWGAPRIHGELLKLGIEVAQSTVAKYMARSGRGRSQTWKTFLQNHAAGIAAMDFLIVPTVGFRLLFVLAILRHERRRLISLSVTANPTAEWIARQVTEAFPWDEAPDHLIRDRDASYGHAVTRRLAAMGIRDHPIAPRSPWQNGHTERLIGSIRRECLDHIVVFGEVHLRRILAAYASYYNGSELICRWIRIRRAIGRSNSSAGSPLSRSSTAFITNTAGYSFQQAQGAGPRDGRGRWLPRRPGTAQTARRTLQRSACR
jgi:transposase InsO family protein